MFEVTGSAGIDQRTLKVSVYSKESKVDDLIGEGALDVTETLRKGEFDGEYTLRPNLGVKLTRHFRLDQAAAQR